MSYIIIHMQFCLLTSKRSLELQVWVNVSVCFAGRGERTELQLSVLVAKVTALTPVEK